jgi:hypothetical protein
MASALAIAARQSLCSTTFTLGDAGSIPAFTSKERAASNHVKIPTDAHRYPSDEGTNCLTQRVGVRRNGTQGKGVYACLRTPNTIKKTCVDNFQLSVLEHMHSSRCARGLLEVAPLIISNSLNRLLWFLLTISLVRMCHALQVTLSFPRE